MKIWYFLPLYFIFMRDIGKTSNYMDLDRPATAFHPNTCKSIARSAPSVQQQKRKIAAADAAVTSVRMTAPMKF